MIFLFGSLEQEINTMLSNNEIIIIFFIYL